MNSFIECPHCASEFIVAEELLGSNMRCPDCFQWVNPFGGMAHTSLEGTDFEMAFSSSNESYDEIGWESGYDY
jgi:predicted Zn finger-like uncharacterized protein